MLNERISTARVGILDVATNDFARLIVEPRCGRGKDFEESGTAVHCLSTPAKLRVSGAQPTATDELMYHHNTSCLFVDN